MKIHQCSLTPALKNHIYEGFKKDALESMGKNGLAEDPIVFEMRKENESLGCVVVHLFWGQLHIKYLFVEEPYRRQGVGRQLMEEALEFGRKRGCTFAFVETMSFQAPTFYEKLGFKKDLVREGFDRGLSFQYLSKKLEE